MRAETLRLALPSDGELYDPTVQFLHSCGIAVSRRTPRRYTAELEGIEGGIALFQRTTDITGKVEEGSAELGIVGLDRYLENRRDGGDAVVVIDDLGFGRCELVLAVPEEWVDVTALADLADLAIEFRERGKDLRVATKYPRLVEGFFVSKGIHYLTLVQASGTLEVAPAMGYADLIGDIVSSGVTLRENGLKTLEDGTMFTSQASLIGNTALLKQFPARLHKARALLERIEAHLRAERYYAVRATLRNDSPEKVVASLMDLQDVLGLQALSTEPPSRGNGKRSLGVTLVVEQSHLIQVVDLLRERGGVAITVSQPQYVFQSECEAYHRLLNYLEGRQHA